MPNTAAENKNGTIAVVTGSTNNAVQDGTARGFFIGVIVFAIGFTEARVDVMSDSELAVVLGLAASGVVVAGGFFDRYVRPRL